MTRSSLFFSVLGSASRWQSRQSNALIANLSPKKIHCFFLWGRGAAVTLEILTCPTQVEREFSQELVFHQFHKIRSDFQHWKTIFPTGNFVQHVPATIRCTGTNHVVSNRTVRHVYEGKGSARVLLWQVLWCSHWPCGWFSRPRPCHRTIANWDSNNSDMFLF